MKRSEVKIEDKWKLEDIYESDVKWEEEYNELAKDVSKPQEYRGRLNDKATLKEFLVLVDTLSLKAERLYGYAHMRKDEDVSNDKYVGMSDRAMSLYIALSSSQIGRAHV